MSSNAELPYLWYIVVLLPQSGFYERFWRILSSPLPKFFKIGQKTAFEAKEPQVRFQRLFNVDKQPSKTRERR